MLTPIHSSKPHSFIITLGANPLEKLKVRVNALGETTHRNRQTEPVPPHLSVRVHTVKPPNKGCGQL